MKLVSILLIAIVIAVSADEYHPKHNRQGAYENRAVVDGKSPLKISHLSFNINTSNMIFRCGLLEQGGPTIASR